MGSCCGPPLPHSIPITPGPRSAFATLACQDLYKLLDSSTSGDAIGLDRNQRASVSEFKGGPRPCGGDGVRLGCAGSGPRDHRCTLLPCMQQPLGAAARSGYLWANSTPAGAWALDLRQWHVGQDAGLLPGKKGVRLDRQQVSALLAAVPALDVEVDEKGRPGFRGA